MARQNKKKTTGGRDENQSQSRDQQKKQQRNNIQNRNQEKSNGTFPSENELDDFDGIPSYGAFLKDMHYDDWDDGEEDLPIEKGVQLKKSETNKKRKRDNKPLKRQENKAEMTKSSVAVKTPQQPKINPKKQQPIESWVLEDEFLFEDGGDSLTLPSYGRTSHPAENKQGDYQQAKELLSKTVSQKAVSVKHNAKHVTVPKENKISSSQSKSHKKKTVQQLPETPKIVSQNQESNIKTTESLLQEPALIAVSDGVSSSVISKGALISLRIDASKSVSKKSSRKERAIRKAAQSGFGELKETLVGVKTGDMTPLDETPDFARSVSVVAPDQLLERDDVEVLPKQLVAKRTAQADHFKRQQNARHETTKSTTKASQSEHKLKSDPKREESVSKNKEDEDNIVQSMLEKQQPLVKGDKTRGNSIVKKVEKHTLQQSAVGKTQLDERRESSKKQTQITEKQGSKQKEHLSVTKGIQQSALTSPSSQMPEPAKGNTQSSLIQQTPQQVVKDGPFQNNRDHKSVRSPKVIARASIDNPNVAADAEGKNQPFDFGGLKLTKIMLESLKAANYREPSPVQAGIIPEVLAGHDVMGQARTGTGKTAAFVIPILEGLDECDSGDEPVALILVPTRELAVQVRDETTKLAQGRKVRTIACYGGKPIGQQINKLKGGVDIIVGTPGRILDLSRRGALTLDSLIWVVLDEADRMLDIGFRPDIEKILRLTPSDRQTLLLSATLPSDVVKLAERYMRHPKVIDFSDKQMAVETIEQYYVTIDRDRKLEGLIRLINEQNPKQAIVFCRTKRGADRVKRQLEGVFKSLESLHGDMSQSVRDRVMSQFRAGKVQILVATDVVGRGIDISGISHIINYDIPQFCDDYVHRVGRTGRMGREGVAYTFVTAEEGQELTRIEMRINQLLKRAELKDFEAVSQITTSEQEQSKPVFGQSQRRVRRAL